MTREEKLPRCLMLHIKRCEVSVGRSCQQVREQSEENLQERVILEQHEDLQESLLITVETL